jgi:ubiquinone/menaquinone biosynthesis C-methylase UbiE
MYQKFAYVYDKIGSDQFSKKMFKYTLRLLARLRYRPKSVLEIACGTGTVAVMWAKRNVTTFAIDSSADMLSLAKKKARQKKVRIDFSRQRLTNFSVSQQVDLVTCFFDSVNYLLTMNDLTACFKAAFNALYDGGYFIFDANTPEAMKLLWGSEIYADETEDVAWIWKNCYFPKIKQAEIRATFFVRKGNIWERFDEIHSERGYTVTELKRALKSVGFKIVNTYDCLRFVNPDRKSVRVAIVAKKVN